MFASSILQILTTEESNNNNNNINTTHHTMTNSDSNSPSTPSSPSSLNHQENNPSPMKSSRKKRMDSKNHIIDIHMRPNLERIIGNEKTLQCFRSFADKKQVLESLDCLVEIKKYKSHLEPLLSQQQQQQQNGLYIKKKSSTSSTSTTTAAASITSSSSSEKSSHHQHQGHQNPNMENSKESTRLSSPRSPSMNASPITCSLPQQPPLLPSIHSSSGLVTQLGKEFSTHSDHGLMISSSSSPTTITTTTTITTQDATINFMKQEETQSNISQKSNEKRFRLNSLLLTRRKSSPTTTSPLSNQSQHTFMTANSPTTAVNGNHYSENQWNGTQQHDHFIVNGIHQEQLSEVVFEDKHILYTTTAHTNMDAESVTSDNTGSTTNSVSTMIENTVLHQYSSNAVKNYEKSFVLMREILDTFLMNEAESEINIDGQSKYRLLGNAALLNLQSYIEMDLMTKYTLFDQVELELLLLVKEDILPRFAQSEEWQNFVLEHGDIANSCCYPEDVKKVLKLRYRKEDLLREYISQKDIDFSEMAASDMSCLKHMLDINGLNIFSTKGDQFVDLQDIGMGGFTNAKIIGFLPFAAEVVISGHCSGYAMTKFVPTTLFDQDHEGKIIPFREHEFEHVDFSNELNKDVYPSWLTKFSVKYPRPCSKRTCYAAGTCVFVKGRYIMINKSVLNPDKYPSEYIFCKNSKMKKEKTTNSLFVSIHVVTPVAKEKCHFVNLLLLNTGGFLNILAESMLKQSLKVCSQQQMTMIEELNVMKKDRFALIEDGYNRARQFISLSLAKFGKTIGTAEGCTFPQTFEEFQKYADS